MKSYYATFYMKSGAEINAKVHCMNEEDIKKALEKIEKMTSKLQESFISQMPITGDIMFGFTHVAVSEVCGFRIVDNDQRQNGYYYDMEENNK